MSENLQFHSKNITSSLIENAMWFDIQDQLIKQVSADIKNLEQHFKSKNLALVYEMPCFFQHDQKVTVDDLNYEYFIKWGRNPANKEFRLLYRQTCEVRDDNNEVVHTSEEVKPLIEARSDIRFALHPFLPLFINTFGLHLKLRSTQLAESSFSDPKVN